TPPSAVEWTHAMGFRPRCSTSRRLTNTSATAPSEIWEELPAVRTPFGPNAGFSFPAWPATSAPGRDGDDLARERPVLHGLHGPLIAAKGEGIHLGPGEPEVLGDALAGEAHELVLV